MAHSTTALTPLVGVALVIAVAIVGMSSIFAFVGLPNSYATTYEACSIGNPCTQTTQVGTSFVPTAWAVVPLMLGGLIGYAMFKRQTGIAWAGIIPLLAFSFVSLASIGILYLPFAVALVGLNAFSQGRKVQSSMER